MMSRSCDRYSLPRATAEAARMRSLRPVSTASWEVRSRMSSRSLTKKSYDRAISLSEFFLPVTAALVVAIAGPGAVSLDAALGTLVVVDAAAYRRAGGHRAVRAEMLEDVALLRADSSDRAALDRLLPLMARLLWTIRRIVRRESRAN